jgi:hypothetical protein
MDRAEKVNLNEISISPDMPISVIGRFGFSAAC